MNRERLLQLADTVENLEHGDEHCQFNMRRVFHSRLGTECGTPSCLQGWALTLFGKDQLVEEKAADMETFEVARELLEISNNDGDILFTPDNTQGCFFASPGAQSFIDGKKAARVLRNFVSTRVIDWSL